MAPTSHATPDVPIRLARSGPDRYIHASVVHLGESVHHKSRCLESICWENIPGLGPILSRAINNQTLSDSLDTETQCRSGRCEAQSPGSILWREFARRAIAARTISARVLCRGGGCEEACLFVAIHLPSGPRGSPDASTDCSINKKSWGLSFQARKAAKKHATSEIFRAAVAVGLP